MRILDGISYNLGETVIKINLHTGTFKRLMMIYACNS
jgi:hypothetical protein